MTRNLPKALQGNRLVPSFHGLQRGPNSLGTLSHFRHRFRSIQWTRHGLIGRFDSQPVTLGIGKNDVVLGQAVEHAHGQKQIGQFPLHGRFSYAQFQQIPDNAARILDQSFMYELLSSTDIRMLEITPAIRCGGLAIADTHILQGPLEIPTLQITFNMIDQIDRRTSFRSLLAF